MEIEGEKCLVTGASGFIGAHLCRCLLKKGCSVIGVGHRSADRIPQGVQACSLDLSCPDEVQALVETHQPSFYFHLASCVKGARSLDLVRPTFEVNLASTVYLMEAASRSGGCQRFILTGSLEEPDDVNDPPSSPYAASKAAASAYARLFAALYDFPAVVAQVFMVYGPDQKDQQKLIPYVINALLNKQSPRMGGGRRMVDWVFVDDVVEGLVRMAQADHLHGQTVALGTGTLHSVRSVAETIQRLMQSDVPLTLDTTMDRPMEQVRAAAHEMTRSQLGWCPETTLDEGLRQTIAWQRQYGPAAEGSSL